jgi:S1-C subfamily serine protease
MDATCNPGNSGSAVINPEDGSVIGVVFAKRTEAFTYAVVSRGFDILAEKILETDKAGLPPGSAITIEMGKEYRPPEDLQADLVKMRPAQETKDKA